MRWHRLFRGFARAIVRRGASFAVVAVAAGVRTCRTSIDRPSNPRAILVIRLDLLGDLLFSMPAVRSLRNRYPNSRLVMLTLPYVAGVAILYPEVDEVISIDTNHVRTLRGVLNPRIWKEYARVWRQVRAEHFDLAVSINGRTASLCALLSGARHTIGYAGDSYTFTLDHAISGGRYRERMHEVDYGRRLGLAAGGIDAPDRLMAPEDPEAAEAIDELLKAHMDTAANRLVLIHAGSLNGSAKRWPVACWAAFADRIGIDGRVRIGIIGSASDASLAHEVLAHASVQILDFTGKTSLPELVCLIARADLVVSGDSGPLHVAVALGRPLVSIYGPTDPAIYGPYHPTAPAVVLRADLPCSPCYSAEFVADCPLGDPICMRLVTVDQVVESAMELLCLPAERNKG